MLILFIGIAMACSSLGGTCQYNEDCCPNPCAPTSCFQGQCIGSYCLGNGNFCQMDCQCCSGTCVQNDSNPGTCGEPTAQIKPKSNTTFAYRPYCEGSYCGPGGCAIGDNCCGVCCPIGTGAVCDWDSCSCYCSGSQNVKPKAIASPPVTDLTTTVVGLSVTLVAVLICSSIGVVYFIWKMRRITLEPPQPTESTPIKDLH